MTRGKKGKIPTMIHKILHKKLTIQSHEPTKTEVMEVYY